MCEKCNSLSDRIKIDYPYQLYDLIKEIKINLIARNLLLASGNCSIDEINENNPFPSDYISHTFECRFCGRIFNLSIETYHGFGGYWDYCGS